MISTRRNRIKPELHTSSTSSSYASYHNRSHVERRRRNLAARQGQTKERKGAVYQMTDQEWLALKNCLVPNYLSSFHLYELQDMKPTTIRNVWVKYDRSQLGEIGRLGSMVLANHCVRRLLDEAKEQIMKKRKNIKPAMVDEMLAKDMPSILPGKAGNERKGTAYMWKLIGIMFDDKQTGRIKREIFMQQWNTFAAAAFGLQRHRENPLICNIL